MVMPILPELEKILAISDNLAQQSVTVFLIGYSFSQLIWGPLSDKFGRRPILLIGLSIGLAGATLTAFSTDVSQFFVFRFMEAVGVGASTVLGRSVLTDKLNHKEVAIAMAYVAIVVGVVPAVAPIIGGFIDFLFFWQGIFAFLALSGATLFVICIGWMPETRPRQHDATTAFGVLRGYRSVLSSRRYVGYLAAYGISFGSVAGYYAAAPFIFVNELGYSNHTYGFLLIANAGCYVFGGIAARMLFDYIGLDRVILLAAVGYIGVFILIMGLAAVVDLNTFSVLIPICIFIFASALVSPAANAAAMTMFEDRRGISTALVGFTMAIGGAVMNAGLSNFRFTQLWQLGIFVAIVAALSLINYRLLITGTKADHTD